MTPFLTIITVVKDDEMGLSRTAESILKQDQDDLEWIIVDSSSTFESSALLNQLREFPQVHIYYQEPSGIYRAMNFAAEKALGSWIWFINAGDFLLFSTATTRAIELIERNKVTALIGTTVVQSTHQGFLYGQTYPEIINFIGYKNTNFHHQGCLFNRKVFIECGGYDEKLKIAADSKLIDLIGSTHQVASSLESFVGFKLGGISGQNYHSTLKEIDTYRPTIYSKRQIIITRLKNYLRLVILRHEESRIMRWYLKRRENKVILELSKLSNLNSPFYTYISENRKVNQGALFHGSGSRNYDF